VDVRQDVILPVRHHRLEGRPGADVLAADHARDLDPLALDPLQALLELLSLGRARSEGVNGLVLGSGRPCFTDVELELGWATPFQRAVLDVLRDVPYGETVTYGELAALSGYPSAQRAAGSVCARNRFAILVPCHRVVSAVSLGSYGSLGTGYKRRLLELEGAL
jgi:O-6-methylguanine DNA methyltransferase